MTARTRMKERPELRIFCSQACSPPCQLFFRTWPALLNIGLDHVVLLKAFENYDFRVTAKTFKILLKKTKALCHYPHILPWPHWPRSQSLHVCNQTSSHPGRSLHVPFSKYPHGLFLPSFKLLFLPSFKLCSNAVSITVL